MRKVLFVIILFSGINVLPQVAFKPKLFVKMAIKFPDYNGGVSDYLTKEEDVLVGAFEIGKNNALWFADKFRHNSFLDYPSDYYLKKLKDPNYSLSDAELKKQRENEYSWDLAAFNKRRVDYSFALMDKTITGDSINICCKYIVMKRAKELGNFRFQYEESYNEIFLKVPLNKEINLKFLSDIYFELSVTATFRIADWEEKRIKAINENKEIHDMSNYVDIYKSLEKSMTKSTIGMTDLKIGFEYLRTDKSGNEILEKANDIQLKSSNLASTEKEFFEMPINIYKGLILLPFKVYDKKKQDIINKSSFLSKLKYNYSILVIPLSEKDGIYTFEIYIPREPLGGGGGYYYKKEIQLKLGEKIRIELRKGHWAQSAIVENEQIGISGDSDFYPFINEYYLLSLDGDK